MHPRIGVLVAGVLASACGAQPPRQSETPSVSPAPRIAAAEAVSPTAVTSPRAGVAISGGTLHVARGGRVAIASDPDRDRIWIVDLETMATRAEIRLRPGDEPGRVVDDGAGRAHVVLRRGGAVVTVDLEHGGVLARREVCPAPRGIAHDATRDALLVACEDGALVFLDPLAPTPRRTLWLEPDLRDVVVVEERIFVSRFRDAEILEVDDAGHVGDSLVATAFDLDTIENVEPDARPRRNFVPRVGWRLAAAPNGDLWMAHQRAAGFPVDMDVPESPRPISMPYYGVPVARTLPRCPSGIVHSALTRFGDAPSADRGTMLPNAALPVDLAISPDGSQAALAFAGESARSVGILPTPVLGGGCSDAGAVWEPGVYSGIVDRPAVAVAWIDASRLAVQYRDPPSIVVYSPPLLANATEVRLGDDTLLRDRGRDVFHQRTPAGMACASCHPEGGDDGHVWLFGDAHGGTRRTQTLGGGVLGGPLHWSGDQPSLDALMNDVFVGRMGAPRPRRADLDALAVFLGALPAPAPASLRDETAVERGRALFASQGCADCHSGARLTDGRVHDVGTGERVKTPTLRGLTARAPYFHDGRVETLSARFETGHTRGHGDLEGLDARGRADLVAYLESL